MLYKLNLQTAKNLNFQKYQQIANLITSTATRRIKMEKYAEEYSCIVQVSNCQTILMHSTSEQLSDSLLKVISRNTYRHARRTLDDSFNTVQDVVT